ncbi:unnamed protein product, partial [marine sediment metagenome]
NEPNNFFGLAIGVGFMGLGLAFGQITGGVFNVSLGFWSNLIKAARNVRKVIERTKG